MNIPFLKLTVVLTVFLLPLSASAQWIYRVLDKETGKVVDLYSPPEQKLDDRYHLIKIPDKRKQRHKSSGLPVGRTEKWTTYYDADLKAQQDIAKELKLLRKQGNRNAATIDHNLRNIDDTLRSMK